MLDQIKQYFESHPVRLKEWEARILIACEAGEIDYEIKRQARSWETCPAGLLAAGFLGRRAARTKAGEPRDPGLKWLGCQFYNSFSEKDFLRAATLLYEIEKRAQEVCIF